jgi:phosphatidylinositol glycan class W
MDAGTAGFVIASGLTSRYARGLLSSPSAKFLSPQRLVVLLLGVGRAVAVKALDYAEHVSEYGTHWNFFVTLFCLWTLVDLVHYSTPRSLQVWTALVLALGYQVSLQIHEATLSGFLLNSYRRDLFSANKEGICSLFGYLPMYLLAESFAYSFFHRVQGDEKQGDGEGDESSSWGYGHGHTAGDDETGDAEACATSSTCTSSPDSCPHKRSHNSRNLKQLHVEETTELSTAAASSSDGEAVATAAHSPSAPCVRRLALLCAVLWLAWLAACSLQPTSRRLVNLAYQTFSLALALSLILGLLLADKAGDTRMLPRTLSLLSKHSLGVFLSANLLTGLVNVSMRTLHASPLLAIVVLLSYSAAFSALPWIVESVQSRFP